MTAHQHGSRPMLHPPLTRRLLKPPQSPVAVRMPPLQEVHVPRALAQLLEVKSSGQRQLCAWRSVQLVDDTSEWGASCVCGGHVCGACRAYNLPQR